MAAQPPFSTNEPRSQLPSALSATSWAEASPAARNRSTHTPAASSLRELSAASCAIARAVPPVVHPPQVKPTIMVAATQPAHDQNSAVLVGREASQRCPRLCFAAIIRPPGAPPAATWCCCDEPGASAREPFARRPTAGGVDRVDPSERAWRRAGVCHGRAGVDELAADTRGRLIERCTVPLHPRPRRLTGDLLPELLEASEDVVFDRKGHGASHTHRRRAASRGLAFDRRRRRSSFILARIGDLSGPRRQCCPRAAGNRARDVFLRW